MSIIVTTESTSDLSPQLQKEYGILTVPMHVVFEDRAVEDGSIPVEEIHTYYKETGKVPTTSAVNPDEYTAFFDGIARDHPGSAILHIGYSSACSCSYQNCLLGIAGCTLAKVYPVDSLNVSGGAGNLTVIAGDLVRRHPELPIEELVRRLEEIVPRIVTRFIPENLDYLLAGGRVSNAQAIGARILSLKPRIDILKGKLIATHKYRGSMKKVSRRLLDDLLADEAVRKEVVYVNNARGGQPGVLEAMLEWLREAGFATIHAAECGCVMTTHGGPGAIGLSVIRA